MPKASFSPFFSVFELQQPRRLISFAAKTRGSWPVFSYLVEMFVLA